MLIGPGTRITLSYRLLDDQGRLFDERDAANPIEVSFNTGVLLAEVEKALVGKAAGWQGTIPVSAKNAFGIYDPQWVQKWPRHVFPPESELKVGQKFNTKGDDDTLRPVRILEIHQDSVTVDGNHPLAGIDLVFEVKVLAVDKQEH